MQQAPVLVLNAGSSSIKYQLFDMRSETALAIGLVERIGAGPDAELSQRCRAAADQPWHQQRHKTEIPDHAAALTLVADALTGSGQLDPAVGLQAIGHRVVHGGDRFSCPALIDDAVLDGIRANIPLAPLHNPANLLGIETTLAQLPDVPQVAVFDTAFHHSLPPRAYHYALPRELARRLGIRRYGFHGTSHGYVAARAAQLMQRPLTELRLITLHLGNGASAAAIDRGNSIDTSMGMTPLEGLVMGTRCGDLDPAIPFYLRRHTELGADQIEQLLNHDSGLTGLAGVGDMREVSSRAAAGDADAELALDLFCYRIRKTIGGYIAALGGIDAVVFTGGIGEHATNVRQRCCDGLDALGIVLDHDANRRLDGSGSIHRQASKAQLWVIPTNEELEIARQTVATVNAR